MYNIKSVKQGSAKIQNNLFTWIIILLTLIIGILYIERLFNKGFTGSNGRNTIYKSTGMGLYFSKKILEKLENSFEVKSVKDNYTIFTIKFNKKSEFTNITKM